MKHYYIRYPRNFANEYDLVWIESSDTESITAAEERGYERITRKEAFRKVSNEKYSRTHDQAFSGYGDIVILPYKAVDLPELDHGDQWDEMFERTDTDRGVLHFSCWTKSDITVDMLSDDGVVFYPVTKTKR